MGRQMEEAVKRALGALAEAARTAPREVLHLPTKSKEGSLNRVEGLNFNDEEEKPATMLVAVAWIVRHFGEAGCTSEDVAGTVQKNLPQWKPTSVTPCLSNLAKLGCIRHQSNFGVRRYYHVRDYDPEADRARLTLIDNDHRVKKILAQQGRIQELPLPAPTQAPAPAPQPTSRGAMIAIGLGANRTEMIDIQTAREIYIALKGIFG